MLWEGIKCPYCLKESSLDEAETLNNFCLTRNCEGTLVLKVTGYPLNNFSGA